jgi:hypothetical protein
MEEGDDQIGRWRPLMVVLRIALKGSDAHRSMTYHGIENENSSKGFIDGAAGLLV